MSWYILKDREPVEVDTTTHEGFLEWDKWYQTIDNRRVARDSINEHTISTVFLGIDHNWMPSGPPLLFETMIFGESELDLHQERCSTWGEAEAMHRRACEMVREKGGAE